MFRIASAILLFLISLNVTAVEAVTPPKLLDPLPLTTIGTSYQGEFVFYSPRHPLMLFFAGRDGDMVDGHATFPTVTPVARGGRDLKFVLNAAAGSMQDGSDFNMDKADLMRKHPWVTSNTERRDIEKQVLDVFHADAKAFGAGKRWIIPFYSPNLPEYDDLKQQYIFETNLREVCHRGYAFTANHQSLTQLCVKLTGLAGLNSGAFKNLAAPVTLLDALTPLNVAVFVECDLANLRLDRKAIREWVGNNGMQDRLYVGECPVTRLYYGRYVPDREFRYEVVAGFEVTRTAAPAAKPVAPAPKSVIANPKARPVAPAANKRTVDMR